MKILIDGDSCCVMSLTEYIAHKHNIECHIYSDTSRTIEPEYDNVQIHTVEKGPNSVDFIITNHCNENDIVITNDVGLATLILSKKGIAISPYGVEFTNDNIMSYLNQKFLRTSATRRQTHPQNMRAYGTHGKKTNYRQTLISAIKRMENIG